MDGVIRMMYRQFREETVSKDAMPPRKTRKQEIRERIQGYQRGMERDKGRMLHGVIMEKELDGLYRFSRMR